MHISIPLLQDESRIISEQPDLSPRAHKQKYPQPVVKGWFDDIKGVISAAAGYQTYDASRDHEDRGCYNRSAEDVGMGLMDDLRGVILSECSKSEGIFRVTPAVSTKQSTLMTDNAPSTSDRFAGTPTNIPAKLSLD